MHRVLLRVGPFEVLSYSVFWSLALLAWALWYRRRAVLAGKDPVLASRAAAVAMAGAFLGAKVGGYFEYWSYFLAHPDRIWRVWESGMVSGTAILGGALASIWYLRRRGEDMWAWGEIVSVPTPFMLSLGRIGCFLNGCCYGVRCDLPWCVVFPGLPGARHPTQLYYVLGNGLIFLLLFALERRIPPLARRERPLLFPLFLLLYGLMRLSVDFLREGDRILGLRVAQWTALVALGVALYARKRVRLKA